MPRALWAPNGTGEIRIGRKLAGTRRVLHRAPLDHISRPVSRVLSARAKHPRVTAIPLRRRLPSALSDPPGRPIRTLIPRLTPLARTRASRRPYSVLLPVGFALPPALPQARCALTAPFHPYRSCLPKRDAANGGLFSVALSLGLTPAGRYPAPYVHGARTFLSRPPFGFDPSDRPAD